MIKKAFDPIRADQELIDRTRDSLISDEGRKKGRHSRRAVWMRSLAAAAVVVLLIGVFTGAGLFLSRATVAAISIDINPSILLDINALNRVISAKAFNEEGTSILADLNLKNLPVKNAVGGIVAAAAQAGYLAQDGSSIIAITTSTDNESLKNRLEQDTEDATQQALKAQGRAAVIYHDNTALARIAEARRLGITPGRLNLIQKLIALDPSQVVDKYLESKVSDIMKEVIRLQNIKRNAEKSADQSTKESEKESERAARESERNAGKETTESGQTVQANTNNSAATVVSENTNPSTDNALTRIEQALNQAQANQAQNNPGQGKR